MEIKLKFGAEKFVKSAKDVGRTLPLIKIEGIDVLLSADMKRELCAICPAYGYLGFACTGMLGDQLAIIYDVDKQIPAGSPVFSEVVKKSLCIEEVVKTN